MIIRLHRQAQPEPTLVRALKEGVRTGRDKTTVNAFVWPCAMAVFAWNVGLAYTGAG